MDLPNFYQLVKTLAKEHGGLDELAKAMKEPEPNLRALLDRRVLNPDFKLGLDLIEVSVVIFGADVTRKRMELL